MRLHAQSDLLHQDANSPIKQPFTEDCRCGMYALEAWNRSLRLTQYSLKQPQLPCSSRKAASREMRDSSCPASSSSCANKDLIIHHRVRELFTMPVLSFKRERALRKVTLKESYCEGIGIPCDCGILDCPSVMKLLP